MYAWRDFDARSDCICGAGSALAGIVFIITIVVVNPDGERVDFEHGISAPAVRNGEVHETASGATAIVYEAFTRLLLVPVSTQRCAVAPCRSVRKAEIVVHFVHLGVGVLCVLKSAFESRHIVLISPAAHCRVEMAGQARTRPYYGAVRFLVLFLFILHKW
jgi:hypothetical protein